MTDQNIDHTPKRRPTTFEVTEALKAIVSIGVIIAGIGFVIAGRVELAIFFVLIGIWIEIGG